MPSRFPACSVPLCLRGVILALVLCGVAAAQDKPLDGHPSDFGVWGSGGFSVPGGTKDTHSFSAGVRLGKVLTDDHGGGFLRGDWFSLVGPAAGYAMSQINVDKVFLGVNGIDAQKGLTSANSGEAAINRVMVDQAKQRIVVADRSKLGAVATYRFCAAKEVHVLITDSEAEDAQIQPFENLGVEVKRV